MPSIELPRLDYLPDPDKGITEEIFFEVVSDPSSFRREMLLRMRDNNLDLTTFMVDEFIVLQSVDAVNWPLAYYEIFERTARRQKPASRLFLVESDCIQSITQKQDIEIQAAARAGDAVLAGYLERLNQTRGEAIAKEVNSSDELAFFWATAKRYEVHLFEVYPNPLIPYICLDPLYTMRELLVGQYEELERRRGKR